MALNPYLRTVGGRATIPSHFTVPAQRVSPESGSSDSDAFVVTPPSPPTSKAYFNRWNAVEAVCSRVLREKRNDGSEGTLYSLGAPVGRGAFGDIFVARALRPDGRKELVCIKRVVVEPVDPLASGQTCAADNEATAMLEAETWLGPKNLMYLEAEKTNGPHGSEAAPVDYAYIEEVLCHGNMNHAVREFEEKHPECLELLVLSMLEQTSKRLAVLHRKGWVHRDIKPDNLLFLNGEIFVGDYGRGKRVRAQDPHLAGLATPGFISPQAASGPCSAADDVWALGATAMEILMGENPFDPTPFVEHPKGSDGQLVSNDDTKLQMPQWKVSCDLLKGYIRWFNDPKKTEEHALTQFFAQMDDEFPRAARLIMQMLRPQSNKRIACEDIVADMKKQGGGLTQAERDELERAWKDITPHPRIVVQRDKLSEAHEPLLRSRTFDGLEIPTGYEFEDLRRRGKAKGVPADVAGLAEKLANAQLADVKAIFDRQRVRPKVR